MSIGEKQLISIAQALIRKSIIIIIDEPASCIDSESEKIVMNAIKTCFKECTVIIISHRLMTL